jgi:ABC-type uncharacterized transport system fused permease/ATPase subunit
MAFTVVFNGATLLIAQFGGISAFAAVTNRVGSLLEELGSAKQTGKTSVLAADNSCAYAVKEAVCENRG